MKTKLSKSINIPEGISCVFENDEIRCRSSSAETSRKFKIPQIEITVSPETVTLSCEKGNKIQYKKIMTSISHLKNMFKGVDKKFEYHLEVVYLHFPITLKIEGNKVLIGNFFGEKVPRVARIMPGSELNIEGQKIIVSSHELESAGQTAANLEKATRVRKKDRRIYQDGIYLTEKPRAKHND